MWGFQPHFERPWARFHALSRECVVTAYSRQAKKQRHHGKRFAIEEPRKGKVRQCRIRIESEEGACESLCASAGFHKGFVS